MVMHLTTPAKSTEKADKGRRLPFVTNPELLKPEAEKELFGNWIEPISGRQRLDHAEESLRFKQLHFCACQLGKLQASLGETSDLSANKEYAKWVGRYHSIRQRLIEANLGLVYGLIRRTRFSALDRDEIASEGMLVLLRAVDTFDPWRGFRFSTYATNAILRALSRTALQDSRRRARRSVSFDPDCDKGDMGERRWVENEVFYLERLDEVMRNNRASLSDLEQVVLQKRFPSGDNVEALTLDRIGQQIHMSKERVRQIQRVALLKLRRAMDDHGYRELLAAAG